ncbi:MAG: hypothetical protein AB7P04_15585, partial [Bacteriovoracia bacterium]
MTSFIAAVRESSRALYLAMQGHAVLAVLTLPGIFFDSRQVTGLNPWFKPLKFDLSILIYAATMAWVIRGFSEPWRRSVGRQIAVCMWVEIVLIYIQAARGVGSHFNVAHPLDGAVFTVMGLFILYNTLQIARVAWAWFRRPPAAPPIYRLAVRWGLVSLLIGSALGGYMSAQMGHTVGAPDGGPGLPWLNWSTQAGDLRVAHFFGLHGIQIFLILGLWLTRRN